MTDATNRTTEIAAYLVAVERHLADLPEAIREDLLSDLDAHLAEVAADLAPGTTLRDLLGSPEAYARELRETAEVPKERVGTRLRRSLRETAAPATRRIRSWADRYAVSSGSENAAELFERLRPGWWVLRGALAALLLVYLLAVSQYNATGYVVHGSLLWGLFTVAAVLFGAWVSLRVGMRSQEWGRRRRWWTGAVGVALALYGLYGFSALFPWYTGGSSYNATLSSEYAGATDVYVYDADGNLLTGVYLFDQNGNPLWIGDPYACPRVPEDPFARETDWEEPAFAEEEPDFVNGELYGYQYPLCAHEQSDDPSEGPEATDGPSAGEHATETEAPGDESTMAEDPDEQSTVTEDPTASAEPSPTETG